MKSSQSTAPNRTPARHEGLKSWVACHGLVLAVYGITSKWPVREQYSLTSQARRAAYSTAANIAEGSAKRGSKEFCRFLNISLGSLSELSYILLLARDLGYLKHEEWGELEALRDHAGRLTWGLYRSLSTKRDACRPALKLDVLKHQA
ncbi:MAG TPA: four helix bundle protein [Gemmatimonadales bacterium]|nr:four helix bundle protein [Gemmatimonadales bacterium]